MIIPNKLQLGDEIRVVSLSSSMDRIGGIKANQKAQDYLESLGYHVTFGRHIDESDILHSASIESRVTDLHEAFLDHNVKLILATIGGFNSNELLPYLDYDLIRQHPKLICGYSDTTAILNAIYAKTGLITYSGPSYSSFKMEKLQDYQTAMWQQAMTQSHYTLFPSKNWSSDMWFLPDCKRELFPTQWKVYSHGTAQGKAIGGNLSTFSLLRGTSYLPQPKDAVLFLESAEEDDYQEFNRNLAALLQVFPQPKALLIGRFPKECRMTEEILHYILDKHPILQKIPVIYDLDFSHTQPLWTYSIGSQVSIETEGFIIQISE